MSRSHGCTYETVGCFEELGKPADFEFQKRDNPGSIKNRECKIFFILLLLFLVFGLHILESLRGTDIQRAQQQIN